MSSKTPGLSSQEPHTLVDILRSRPGAHPGERSCVLVAGGQPQERPLTYGALWSWAQAVALGLQEVAKPGDRVLILQPGSLEFLASFFGCLAGGFVAVPAYPPHPARADRAVSRLAAIAHDADVKVALSTARIRDAVEAQRSKAPTLPVMRWLDIEATPRETTRNLAELPHANALAFLQYTSGSTGLPKGVMVGHRPLLENEEAIRRTFDMSADSRVVSWLPLFHDMGLIGFALQPVYVGATAVILDPAYFMQRPVRWLQAISRYHGTTSGGPNFGYAHCVDKVTDAEKQGLDLSSWQHALNGAEPVRIDTLERFAQRFASCGFRRHAFQPCYGLAEATLLVSASASGRGPRTLERSARALSEGRSEPPHSTDDTSVLVSCGAPAGWEVAIVEPESGGECAADTVGEIWIRGPSMPAGYRGREEDNATTFAAALSTRGGGFLRTGDLGVLHGGELFITGRLKDLIIIAGKNHYPQDLERTAESAHPAVRSGGVAAFALGAAGTERAALVVELDPRAARDLTTADAHATVRRAIAMALARDHDIGAAEIHLAPAGSVPKTSSGKVQRRACRALIEAGSMERL